MSYDRTSADDMPRRTLANPARLRASTAYPEGQAVGATRRDGRLRAAVALSPERASSRERTVLSGLAMLWLILTAALACLLLVVMGVQRLNR